MSFFFDFIITSFLLISLLLLLSLLRDRARRGTWEARHRLMNGALATLLGVGWITVFYGSFIEPEIISINRRSLDLPNYQGPAITIALVSDIHAGPYVGKPFIGRLSKKILALHPDFLFLDGDIIYNRAEAVAKLSPISRAAAAIPSFAVLGDHDYLIRRENGRKITNDAVAGEIRGTMGSFGITVLSNESVPLAEGLTLVAVDDLRSGKTDLPRALASADPKTAVVLLSHNPDVMLDPLSRKADLVLSGNTHGGQIRLPFIGPVATIPDALGQKYDEGLFEFGNTRLFITSGVGSSGPRARLFNPPEIALLTIY